MKILKPKQKLKSKLYKNVQKISCKTIFLFKKKRIYNLYIFFIRDVYKNQNIELTQVKTML